MFVSLLGLLDASCTGLLSLVFWGPIPQLGVLKVGALGVDSKPFVPEVGAGS